MRAALFGVLLACTASHPGSADDFYREDLHISMAAAGPPGLEALLIRPSGPQRYPLALISHGTAIDASERRAMSPYRYFSHAIEFARRGFAAVVVMRRGFGESSGGYPEGGCCNVASYLRSARTGARDLRAAIDAMNSRSDVTTEGMIAVGVSAGGFASIALTEDPPPGLGAVISFAGGRRRTRPSEDTTRDLSDEAALIGAFQTIGKTSRIPTLWIYAENDKYFGPDVAHGLHAAFTAGGGRAEFIDAPAFGSDGHSLFGGAGGKSIWLPTVDRFLHQHNLGSQELLAPPTTAALSLPPGLGEKGRAGFADYLAAGQHKAFVTSPRGAFGYRAGMRSAAEALSAALTSCAKHAPDCAPYAIDDQPAAKASSGSL
jgi:dienelactone hydrolase